MNITKIILGSGKEQSLRRFHPWVFSGAIKKILGQAAEGDLVSVYSNKDEYLGFGMYSTGSIAIRMLSFAPVDSLSSLIHERIHSAVKFRLAMGFNPASAETNAFRVVFGEGDGLPGLIADYYAGTIVLQCHAPGMWLNREIIASALKEVFGEHLEAIYDKSAESLPDDWSAKCTNGYLFGKASGSYSMEHGIKYFIDWKEGQKTGFFLDQRDSRRFILDHAAGKTILNTFCYSGGFSMAALKGQASLVVSVDSSRKAMELTSKNHQLNAFDDARHEMKCEDVFNFLEQEKRLFDIIILDPPAFAKHHHARHKAVMGYKRLNQLGMQRLKPGGLLLTYSCSQAVDRMLFTDTVRAAAIQSGRKARIVHYTTQPPDHSASFFHPEGEYLKGIVLSIDEG